MKEVNIKDFVRQIQLKCAEGNKYILYICIDAGAKSNLKPELLLNAMASYFDTKFFDIKTQRKEIYFD